MKTLGLGLNNSLRDEEFLYAIVEDLNNPDWSTFTCLLDHHFQKFLDDYQGNIWMSTALKKVSEKRRKKGDMTGECICFDLICVTILHWIVLDIIALHVQKPTGILFWWWRELHQTQGEDSQEASFHNVTETGESLPVHQACCDIYSARCSAYGHIRKLTITAPMPMCSTMTAMKWIFILHQQSAIMMLGKRI